MTDLKLITTDDGSHSLYNRKMGEHYHSSFGAIQESQHIFIQAGLAEVLQDINPISVLEIGFGTGLNALLSLHWAIDSKVPIAYHGLEAYPLADDLLKELNYHDILKLPQSDFLNLHQKSNQFKHINGFYKIRLETGSLETASFQNAHYDLVFFDAFSPDTQPEMWTSEMMRKLFLAMKPGAILTTYSCKGMVKRALKLAGFQIEKLAGPPGKREFLRARKK